MSGVKGRSGGKRIGSGRRAFMPTIEQREQVAYLAQLGLSGEDIFCNTSQSRLSITV